MKFKIREEGSESLYLRCEDVPSSYFDDDKFSKHIEKMIQFMKDSDGVGLSAPQIGINLNYFVMAQGDESFACINPKILKVSQDNVTLQEGCLSFPGMFLDIERPSTVTTAFLDANGDLQAHEFQGMWSRIFMHEYDHLCGKLFTQYVGSVKLGRARSKAKKLNKQVNRIMA